jgi:hypothetical protein
LFVVDIFAFAAIFDNAITLPPLAYADIAISPLLIISPISFAYATYYLEACRLERIK